MSVKHIYEIAEREEKCRVCKKQVDKKELRRGRCGACDYKNLEPIE